MLQRSVAIVLSLPAVVAQTAAAQRGSAARLVLTVRAGATITQPSLWSIARQPLLVLGTEGDPQPLFDTVNLARDFATNLLVGVTGTYFPKSAVALEIGVTGLGLTTETSCRGVYFDSLLGGANHDLCAAIQGSARSLGAIVITAGLLTRAFPRSGISPHAHVGVAVTFYSVSTTYVEGQTPNGIRVVVDDRSPTSAALRFAAGVGATIGLGPGYRFRFDFEDVAQRLPHLTGPADRLARAPRAFGFSHHVLMTLGFGIVLESKHGRRY